MFTYIIQDINFSNNCKVCRTLFLPRISDAIPIFYNPHPIVKSVVLNVGTVESKEIFDTLQTAMFIPHIHAIVYVE